MQEVRGVSVRQHDHAFGNLATFVRLLAASIHSVHLSSSNDLLFFWSSEKMQKDDDGFISAAPGPGQ